jgi:hypothetical protein
MTTPNPRRVLVSGIVVDGARRPLAGVYIGIGSGDHPFPEIGAISRDDGSFHLPPLIPGRYVVWARSATGSASVAIQAREDVPNHVTIVIS